MECKYPRINTICRNWQNFDAVVVAAAAVAVGVGWGGSDDDVVVGTAVDLAVLFGAGIDPSVDASAGGDVKMLLAIFILSLHRCKKKQICLLDNIYRGRSL